MHVIALLLLLAVDDARIYHRVAVAQLARSTWTHVEVIGRVTLVRDEADGDIHFRVADPRGRFVVAEIIPLIPLARPAIGQRVIVRGIRRWDSRHRWIEVHPVEALEVQP
jgi:hypothetical protein